MARTGSGGSRNAPGATASAAEAPGPTARTSSRRTAARPKQPAIPLIETKLGVPVERELDVERLALSARMDVLSKRALTIVTAPTGYGKTTALAAWARSTETTVAWIALDSVDNDPARYLSYIVTALARASGVRDSRLALRALRRAATDPIGTALPYLLNAVGRLVDPVVLVLDDYQRIEHHTCHQATRLLVEQSSEQFRVILSTRVDPPLPLGLLRARGALGELRASELAFSDEEVEQLVNGSLGLELEADLVEQLGRRTEGWPAGLYLAALSVAGAPDRRAFVEGFAGSHRHIVEYLATEVLDAQPDDVQQFLLQTAILDRLSASLCDAVRVADDSSAQLESLVATNLFLTPLDPSNEWFRYHRLFLELLRSELMRRTPALAQPYHQRAAEWYDTHGELEETVNHALAAGDEALAGRAIAAHWRPLYQFGQHAALRRLLDRLPQQAVNCSAPLSFVAALLAGSEGASREVFDGHLRNVDESGWEGPLPDGTQSIEVARCFAEMVYPYGDLGRSLAAADRMYQLVPGDPVLGVIARVGRGRALYLLGEYDAVAAVLPALGRDTASALPQVSAMTPAFRSLLELEQGHAEEALQLAREAAAIAEEIGVGGIATIGIVWLALGAALAAGGDQAEAECVLERAVESTAKPAGAVLSAHALVRLARIRAGRGKHVEARKLLVRARAIVDWAAEPGIVSVQLDELERRLSTRSRRTISFDDLPTEGELKVLRLMASDVTRSEIAQQLFLSPNTVKSHQRALYRKLGAHSRETAVARARELGFV